MFEKARAPTGDELQDLLDRLIARVMKMLTRPGELIEEQGMSDLAETDADDSLASLQAGHTIN